MINLLKDGFHRNTWWSRLLFCSLIPAASLIYVLCNQIAAAGGSYLILTFPVDDLIPFVSVFVIPYVYWYLLIAWSALWLVFSKRTGRLLHRMVTSIALASLIAAVFYLAMPTRMIRIELDGSDFLTRMVRLIYESDLPYNCFPSMHVAWSMIICRYMELAGPKRLWFRLLNYGGVLLIIASTVLIKQHYTPDILGGAAVAVLACVLSDCLFRIFKAPVS